MKEKKKRRTKEIKRERWWAISEQEKQTFKEKKEKEKKIPQFRNSRISVLGVLVLLL
jgi:hypothetical protein